MINNLLKATSNETSLFANSLILGLGKKQRLYFVQLERIKKNRLKYISTILSILDLKISEICLLPTVNGVEIRDSYKSDNILNESKVMHAQFTEDSKEVLSVYFSDISRCLGYTIQEKDCTKMERDIVFNNCVLINGMDLTKLMQSLKTSNDEIQSILLNSIVF